LLFFSKPKSTENATKYLHFSLFYDLSSLPKYLKKSCVVQSKSTLHSSGCGLRSDIAASSQPAASAPNSPLTSAITFLKSAKVKTGTFCGKGKPANY
jgi:hypothetical protein